MELVVFESLATCTVTTPSFSSPSADSWICPMRALSCAFALFFVSGATTYCVLLYEPELLSTI